MDEIGEYHGKWDKPIYKIQKTNDLTDKRMMTLIGGEKGARMEEGGTVYREKRSGRSWGRTKITEWIKDYYPRYMYDYTNGMPLLHVQIEK